MSLKLRPHDSARRVLPRAAAVALALGGLATSLVAADAAGATSRTKALVISTTTNPKYGTILVSGTTVYTLKTASKVPCGVKCLKVWPQVLLPKGVKQAKAGNGVNASKLGTVKRRGGALQVTYAGKALYWFYEDSRPNQVKGDVKDKWGTWSVVVMSSATSGTLPPAAAVPTTAPMNQTTPTNGTTPTTGRTTPGGGTTPPAGTTPTSPPTTAPTTTTTTSPPTTTTTSPPTTTTTSGGGGGGGIGF